MDALSKINSLFKSWMEPKRDSRQFPPMFINQARFIPDMPIMKSQGRYLKGHPEGLIIHYTAGNPDQTGESAISLANKNGHQYFFIDKHGELFQQFSLDEWGYHAGESVCPVTGRKGLSKYYAGVEIACPGLLDFKDDKFFTWYNTEVDEKNVRYFGGSETQRIGGSFYKYTEEQENTLYNLALMFCIKLNVPPTLILGHDEVSPGRKSDPGGSLSMSMEFFRMKLRNETRNLRNPIS